MTIQALAVQFHDQSLTAAVINDVPHVAMKPVCENIGLHWEGQRQRIKRHPVLNSVAFMIKATGIDGKQYDMFMLPIDYLNGWLFGVDANRVKPEIKDRLIEYQRECFKVLADYFKPKQPETKPFKSAFPPNVKPFNNLNSSLLKNLHEVSRACAEAYLITNGVTPEYIEYIHDNSTSFTRKTSPVSKKPALDYLEAEPEIYFKQPEPTISLDQFIDNFVQEWAENVIGAPFIMCLDKQMERFFVRYTSFIALNTVHS